MSKLKVLSGEEIVAIFEKFGFVVVSQKGSHVKLRRVIKTFNQTLTVPLHKELAKGTLMSIYRTGSQYVSEEDLRSCFYLE